MSRCVNCSIEMSDFDARQSLLCTRCRRYGGDWSRVRNLNQPPSRKRKDEARYSPECIARMEEEIALK